MPESPRGIYALDPRDRDQLTQAVLAARPASLDGRVLGLLSNNKPHSEDLLRMMARDHWRAVFAEGSGGIQQGRPPMARRPQRVGRFGPTLRRDDSRHCGMRLLHLVQCARRDGDGAAGGGLHGVDHQALRESSPRHGPGCGGTRTTAWRSSTTRLSR